MSKTLQALILLLVPFIAACEPKGQATQPPSIILISIDTLRPDHLGCYGYDKPTSPAIDALCADAVVFEHAAAHAPSTLPSHASMLTSLLPQHHGASFENERALPTDIETLAEVLAKEGYRTAAFNGGGQIDPLYGLGQGFERYEVTESENFQDGVAQALNWIEEVGDEPYFLFLHTYQVHHPYDPSPEVLKLFKNDYDGPLSDSISVHAIKTINAEAHEDRPATIASDDLAHIVATYDAEIREVDEVLDGFFEALKSNGSYQDSVIAVTSDHGEEFAEHGFVGWHSHSLFEELLRVPLIIKFPQMREAGRRVGSQVRSIDIAPTLLKAAGKGVPETYSGIDLAALWSPREVPTLTAVARLDRADKAKVSAISDGEFKLVRPFSRRQKLFNLAEDPEESWDDSTNNGQEVTRLETLLKEILASRPTPNGTENLVSPDEALRQKLIDLGYIANTD